MSRSAMLLVLAAVVGYSANRFDVPENIASGFDRDFVPALQSACTDVVSAARAVAAYALEGQPGVAVTIEPTPYWLGRVCVWVAAAFSVIWAATGVAESFNGETFPGGFRILAEEKHCRVWMVIVATLFLPLEAVARLLCIAIRIASVPCRLAVRVLNFDLSKPAEGKAAATDPADPSTESSEPPRAGLSHWTTGPR